MNATRTLTALALLVATATTASAYEPLASEWDVSTVSLKLNLVDSTLLPDQTAVLETAESKINANSSALRFSMSVDDDVVSASDNGESEILFTDDSTSLCSSKGCTWVWAHGDGIIDEADVFLKLSYDWALDDYKWDSVAYTTDGTRPLLNTAMHELLHAMSLAHENDCINLLGNAWNVVSTNGDYTETAISEDSTKGLIDIYGPRSTTINDLSVMHWKLDVAATGTSEYSHHMRSRLLDGSGTELTEMAGYDEPTYIAWPGETIQVEMTLENRGSSTESRKLGVYWSTNSTISTSDTRLSSTTPVLGVNTPYETAVTVTVPTGATPGKIYWVGAIIDRDDALSESNEINNAAYIAAIYAL